MSPVGQYRLLSVLMANRSDRSDVTMFVRKHNPNIHKEYVPGNCTCGKGPDCPDCQLCFNCGMVDYGLPCDANALTAYIKSIESHRN